MSRPHRALRHASRTISRSRRRTRLRSTALPTFLETVNPTRTGPSSRRSRACSTNAAAGSLGAGRGGQEIRPLPQPLHGMAGAGAAGLRRSAACGRARAGRPGPCGRPWSPCGRESRDGACAPACSVDRSASRSISPLSPPRAAYTGAAAGRASMRPDPRPAPVTDLPRLIREMGPCPSMRRQRRGSRSVIPALVYTSCRIRPPR